MPMIQMIPTSRPHEWNKVLSRVVRYDFYHTPWYHALAELVEGGVAYLLSYSNREFIIGLPLVFRPIAEIAGLQHYGLEWQDASSVYGYAGPIASHNCLPSTVLEDFHASLRATLQTAGVVSLFSRLHPLLDQEHLLTGIGDVVQGGQTVSIDLKLSLAEQRGRFRPNHKTGLNKLGRAGVICVHDSDLVYLDQFISIYHETMERVDARPDYFFEAEYFHRIVRCEGFDMRLFVALLDNEPISAGLFSACQGIVQYHLGGTRTESLPLAPMKLVFDTVRIWATEQNFDVFHLGGGVGSNADSLFHFKSGFSDRRHQFSTWRWIVLPDQYEEVDRAKADWNRANNAKCVSPGYFPSYRCPTEPAIHDAPAAD